MYSVNLFLFWMYVYLKLSKLPIVLPYDVFYLQISFLLIILSLLFFRNDFSFLINLTSERPNKWKQDRQQHQAIQQSKHNESDPALV